MTSDFSWPDAVGGLRRTVARKGSRFVSGRKPSPRTAGEVPPPPAPAIEEARKKTDTVTPQRSIPPAVDVPFQDDASLTKADRLARLRSHLGECRRCPLGATRIQLAFGVGNPDARVVVIGEGPGYAEDRRGEPFVGPAGQLLDKILAAVGLSRAPVEDPVRWVYIANMVKCHPMIDPSDNTRRSNDRPPSADEMAVCSPFLMAQIRIIQPWFIVALGNTAGRALLKTEEGISKFRGRWVDFTVEGMPSPVRLMPTYHPAALLRNPGLKKDVWEDMKQLRDALQRR